MKTKQLYLLENRYTLYFKNKEIESGSFGSSFKYGDISEPKKAVYYPEQDGFDKSFVCIFGCSKILYKAFLGQRQRKYYESRFHRCRASDIDRIEIIQECNTDTASYTTKALMEKLTFNEFSELMFDRMRELKGGTND